MIGCALAIGMALDTSISLTATQRQMMLDGVAGALESRAEDMVGVVLHVYTWGSEQADVVMATMRSPADVYAAAALIRASNVRGYALTATGSAMLYGAARMAETGCSDQRLNIITDGENNAGPSPSVARDSLTDWRLQVNAVGVGKTEEAVRAYLEANVITGSGAFVEYAEDWDRAFREAVDRKLGRELPSS